MTCSKCGQTITFDGGTWAHVDGEVMHPVIVGSDPGGKPTEEHPFDFPDTVRSPSPLSWDALTNSPLYMAVIGTFLEEYWALRDPDGNKVDFPWQRVRKHDRGMLCYCPMCRGKCKICEVRRRST